MRVSLRPAGARMVRNSSAKLKVLELLPKPPANGSWGAAWAAYPSAGFDGRMAYAKSVGANAIKIASWGLTASGFPAPAQCELYVQDFCGLLRKYGLRLYLGLSGGADFAGADGSQTAANVPLIAAHVALWMKHGPELLVGIDVCNEVQWGQPSTWPGNGVVASNAAMRADLSALLAGVRGVAPGVPLSFSVYQSSPADMTGALMQLQAQLGCDFHDYHPYNGHNGHADLTASAAPGASDPAALEAASWFIGRHFIGECGILNSNTDAATSAWITGMAAQAARPLSLGGTLFGDIDYTSSSEPGNYGITGHTAQEAACRAWNGAQL